MSAARFLRSWCWLCGSGCADTGRGVLTLKGRKPGRVQPVPWEPAWAVARLLALPSAGTTAIAADDSSPSPELNTVVVTSNHLPVQSFIDRKVYTLTDDLQASFGTLSDVLADIPSVNVDPDGMLSWRGDSHVLILVDGKPSPLFSGANAGENLQSFPAENIERIEVLTNPPPQARLPFDCA